MKASRILFLLVCVGTAGCQLFLPDLSVGKDASVDVDAAADQDAAIDKDTLPEPDVVDAVDVFPDLDGVDAVEEVIDVPSEEELTPLVLVWKAIPAGTFEMGCSTGDMDCQSSENPRHPVTVTAFEITETEITQAQYEVVKGSHANFHEDCLDCPVEQVTWHEAKAFCEAIGGRLPTEAEWEYAARAGTTTRYYCGDSTSCLVDIAWYDVNSGGITHPVKGKAPNGFGLYDMLGNAWEWVEDCRHDTYTNAPSTGYPAWISNCDDGNASVVRGCSWFNRDKDLRVSQRSGLNQNDSSRHYGFRCAR